MYQELMKEGASNCVERHLNLNDCDTSLLWTYSQVGQCCFHSQRITPRAVRRHRYVDLWGKQAASCVIVNGFRAALDYYIPP